MSFYVTLPSHASVDTFPQNHASQFTTQLPERLILEEQDWEVALASVSLPDSRVYVDPNKLGSYVLEEGIPGKTTVVTSSQLVAGRAITDGISLFTKLTSTLRAKSGLQARQKHWIFDWDKRGEEDVLVLNPKTITTDFFRNQTGTNYLAFGLNFALKFHLVKALEFPTPADSYEVVDGKRLTLPRFYTDTDSKIHYYKLGEALSQERRTTAIHPNVKNQGNSRRWWEIKYNPNHSPEPQVILWPYCNWVLYGMEYYFRQLFGSPARSLYLYTDIGQSQIVGNEKSDLLREFPYVKESEGSFYYEPFQLRFLPIRRNVIETITVTIRDPHQQPVTFQGDSTIVTLKFERRSAHL